MVYRGPSLGCQPCKHLHTKCDQNRPICGKCAKSHRNCFGWPQAREGGFLFLDQTTKIVCKKGETDRRRRSSQPATEKNALYDKDRGLVRDSDSDSSSLVSTSDSSSSDLIYSVQQLSPAPIYWEPAPSALDAAVALLYSGQRLPKNLSSIRASYAAGMTEVSVGKLYASSNISSALVHAQNAVASSELCQFVPESKELAQISRVEYSKALRALRSAINDPVLSKTDGTLMATLSMAAVEFHGMKDATKLQNYASHLKGAALLVRHRGVEANNNHVAWKLFQQTRRNVTSWCIQRSQEMPQGIDWTCDSGLGENPLRELAVLALPIAHLRAVAAKPESLSGAELVHFVLEATKIDAALAAWYENLGTEFLYHEIQQCWDRTTPGSDNPYVWRRTYHVYADAWVAAEINRYRAFRIQTNREILNIFESGSSSCEKKDSAFRFEHSERALRVLQEMVDGICFSVPSFLGRDAVHMAQLRSQPIVDNWTIQWLAPPLGISSSIDTISIQQQQWIRGRMDEVAQRTAENTVHIIK